MTTKDNSEERNDAQQTNDLPQQWSVGSFIDPDAWNPQLSTLWKVLAFHPQPGSYLITDGVNVKLVDQCECESTYTYQSDPKDDDHIVTVEDFEEQKLSIRVALLPVDAKLYTTWETHTEKIQYGKHEAGNITVFTNKEVSL